MYKHLYIIFLLATISCKENAQKQEAANGSQAAAQTSITLSEAQLKNAQLETGSVTWQALSAQKVVNGFIEAPPQNLISVGCPLGGYLRHTQLLPGMSVKKGDILAVLEAPEYIQIQQDYLSTKARLEYLKLDLERQTALNKNQSASDKTLQTVASEVKMQQITLSALGQKLQLLGIDPNGLEERHISKSISLRAPVTGFVTRINGNTGKYIAATETLVDMIDPKDIHLTLKVFEKDLSGIQVGQKVWAFTNANPGKKIPAKIILINKIMDEDRSVQLHCHFEHLDPGLVVGQYMNASIEMASEKTMTLPEEAVVRYENRFYIFVQKGANDFDLHEVSSGENSNGFVSIASKTGADLSRERIVLKNAYTLLMSLKNTSE